MNNLYLFLAGLMAGMILFQAALNAPTIFKVYSEEQAGPFLRAIFPKLFLNVAILTYRSCLINNRRSSFASNTFFCFFFINEYFVFDRSGDKQGKG